MALVSRRIAAIYSALMLGEPCPPASFGSLQGLIDCESAYEASADYIADRDYWSRNLPVDCGHHPPRPLRMLILSRPCPLSWTRPSLVGRGTCLRRCAFAGTQCLPRRVHLLVRGCSAATTEVALDFPVSRRVTPGSKTLPGMLSGVVPLVVKTSPTSTVAEFCQHVDRRIRELLRHQRFPVHLLKGEDQASDRWHPSARVSVNFIPSRLSLDFAGVPSEATYTNLGPVGYFSLCFLGSSDQLSVSAAGVGQPFP